MNAGSLLLVFVLIAIVAVMRVIERSWFGAATFFGLYWASFLTASIVLVPGFTLTFPGVAWVIVSYLALIVGTTAARNGDLNNDVRSRVSFRDERAESNILTLVVLAGALLALCSVPVLVSAAGVSVFDLNNSESFLQVAGYYTSNRYNDPSFREPNLGIALYSFSYLASILGGRLFVVGRGVSVRGVAVTPILVAALLSMLMTTRALVLLSLLLWASGYMVSTVGRGRQRGRVVEVRTVFLVTALCCAAIVLFVGGQLVRGGGADKVSRQEIYASVATSFLGSTSAFTMWFDQTSGGQLDAYGLGARTLSGELDWLIPGFHRADVATFEPVVVGNGSGLGEDTTVATLFREWIYDFSPTGCLILFILLGFFGGRAFAGCSTGGIVRGAGLAAYYLIVLYSMMGFVYKFTTMLAVSLAFGFYCRYLSTKRSHPSVAVEGRLVVLPSASGGGRG